MSRCFPFPPPGYEREHKLEDLALLKEVKLKEKKHKKDKERKKDKEKKERDGSDEKQRDKKDRKRKHKDKKEKHRDKKNDKEDRVKDRDKSSISEESTVAGKFEERSEEKLQLKGHGKDNSVADKGKTSTFFQGQNGGKTQSIISQAINDAKFAPELDRWIRHDEKGGGSLFLGRAASVDKSNSDAAPGTALRNSARVLGEDKSNDRDKRVHIKKMEPQGLGGQFTSKAMVENLVKMGNSKSEGPPKPMEEQNDRRLDIKENFNKTGDDERGRKQKERDKKSKEKDKEKKKEKKRKEKREEKAKLKIEHEKSTSNCTNDHIVAASNKSTKLLKDDSAALTEENGRKRKDTDTNGFLHESEIRPNKVQGFALRQSTDNGNKLEAFHVPSKSSSGNHPIANNARLHHLDRLINGVNEAQRPSASKPISFVTNIVNDQMVVDLKTTRPDSGNVNEPLRVPKMKDPIAEEVPRKPPHPDSKYLPQVLTVPKVDDWSGDDDLEWLFSKKVPPKRPHPESHVKEAPCVWSETVHIEPADVYALPYVIPY